MSRGKRDKIPARMRDAVYAKGEGRCYLCGDAINRALDRRDPLAYQVDHVVPVSKGGGTTLTNLRAAHAACNNLKDSGSVTSAREALAARRGGSRDWSRFALEAAQVGPMGDENETDID